MKHLFKKGPHSRTLLLLHGTGGNEQDLLPLANMIDSHASILGVRGNVNENGMPRFFRRIAEGVFDEEDLVYRTKELNEFLDTSAEQYDFDRERLVAVGYSNGANIAASLLFHYKKVLEGAILHHPMVPLRGIELPDMTDIPVMISAGRNDPICPPEETEELAARLKNAGAEVEVYWHDSGHQLTRSEVEKAMEWYGQHFG
ncbi:MAG TPA: alpha/beta hydrolase [Bacillales bacterium]|nr:alpha/beta hydrolase [Bacillales bacterium]